MEFSTKKMICKISAIVIALSSAVAMALPAFANHVAPTYSPIYTGNFISYSHTWNGSKSKLDTNPNSCVITATNSDFYGKYKRVDYYVYQRNADYSYTYITGDTDYGNDIYVDCNPSFNPYAVARKLYYGEIRQGTNSGTLLQDDYDIDVRLPLP